MQPTLRKLFQLHWKPLTTAQFRNVALAISVTFPMVVGLTMVNVALPAIALTMGMRLEEAQLLTSCSLLAATICALLSGHLWARFGPRNSVCGALVVFIIGSIVAACSPSPGILIAGRILQGCAAGVIQPLSLLLVAPFFPPNRIGMAMGLVGMGVLLAPAVGPVYAGWVVDHFGWRALFISLCPWCLVCLAFASRILRTRNSASNTKFDWIGFVLLIGALSSFMVLMTQYQSISSLHNTLLMCSGIIVSLCFIAWQVLNPDALIDFTLFTYPGFSFYCTVILVLGFGIFGSVLLVPLLLQTVASFTAETAGLALLPAGIAMALVSPVCGYMCDRWSPTAMLSAGLALFSISSFLLSNVSITDISTISILVIVGRIALALIFPAVYSLSLYALPASVLPQGSSIVNFIRQLGGSFGTAFLVLAVGHQEILWFNTFTDTGQSETSIMAAGAALSSEAAIMFGENIIDTTSISLLMHDVLLTSRAEAFRDLFLLTGWMFAVCAALTPAYSIYIRIQASNYYHRK